MGFEAREMNTTPHAAQGIAGPTFDFACKPNFSRDLFLQVHVGEAERLLAVVLDLQFVFLVELHLAEWRE
jgi:hypothetical protein